VQPSRRVIGSKNVSIFRETLMQSFSVTTDDLRLARHLQRIPTHEYIYTSSGRSVPAACAHIYTHDIPSTGYTVSRGRSGL